jgi:hypothetical protein
MRILNINHVFNYSHRPTTEFTKRLEPTLY